MTTIFIYMEDGRVFHYDVIDAIKAREHAHRIINYGWRAIEGEEFCYYPVHQVLKVKFKMKELDKLAEDYESKTSAVV